MLNGKTSCQTSANFIDQIPHDGESGNTSRPSLIGDKSIVGFNLYGEGRMLCIKEEKEMQKRLEDWIMFCFARPRKDTTSMHLVAVVVVTIVLTALFWATISKAESQSLMASWYSVQSLKEEGTWSYSKGVMANGRQFSDNGLTAASRDYPLGTKVKVTRLDTGAVVEVMVSDRCNKRFAGKRIDLSKSAFNRLADCRKGLIPVQVEVVK